MRGPRTATFFPYTPPSGSYAQSADRGDPADAVPRADHDLRDDENGVPGFVGEGDAGEGDGSGAGESDLVVDVHVLVQSLPPGVGLREPIRPAGVEAGGRPPVGRGACGGKV